MANKSKSNYFLCTIDHEHLNIQLHHADPKTLDDARKFMVTVANSGEVYANLAIIKIIEKRKSVTITRYEEDELEELDAPINARLKASDLTKPPVPGKPEML